MKPKTVLIIFVFLILHFTFIIPLSAADTWVKTYRPFQEPYMEDDYSVEDVIVTQDSGYVVSGSFELCDEFYYEHWGFLMKTDKDGNMLWARKDSVEFMSENGYEVDFTETDNGCLLSIGYAGFGGDRYMIKRNSEGNRLWAIPYNTGFGVFSMHNTQDGNIILAGRSDYNAALRKITEDGTTLWTKIIDVGTSIAYSVYECTNGDYVLTGVDYDNYNILVIRTDSLGDSLWTRTFDGLGGHDQGKCVTETLSGNILVGGFVRYSAPIYGYGFLAKINSVGDTLWTKNYSASILNPFLSLIDLQDSIAAYGGSYGEAKLLKLNSEGEILNENDIYGYRSTGDRCFQKIENGYICLSREGMYNSIIVLNKTDENGEVPVDVYEISQIFNIDLSCYPNPFNSDINILCTLKEPSKKIQLSIYNIKGQLVKELFSKQRLEKGKYSVLWNGKNSKNLQVSSGLYFIILKKDNRIIQTKKIIKIGG